MLIERRGANKAVDFNFWKPAAFVHKGRKTKNIVISYI